LIHISVFAKGEIFLTAKYAFTLVVAVVKKPPWILGANPTVSNSRTRIKNNS
jgi:hypothetical protein